MSATIRTPDHRVRVFVSSTLQELAAERGVVRDAIQRVHLTPVLFEQGARAHPPRDLYRAYLAQSDVFVGVYWQRYGWVAPDMTISGLEDEYVLGANHPKLIYVKRADEREPQLQQLLKRIQDDDRVAYRPFSTAEELADLVSNDLIAMLSETFTSGPASGSKPRIDVPADERPVDAPPPHAAPAERGALLGRDDEVARIQALLADREPGFVTLTGPGGTGKTRLAIHVAHQAKAAFPEGVYYVPLASVRDPSRVVPTILQTLEVPLPQGGGDPARVLVGALRRQRALLILDNFEQIIDAAPTVGDLCAECPELKIIVTSQHALRVQGENEVPIPTLPTDGRGSAPSPAEVLFERRAREVMSAFRITDENRAAVREICRRLDGLPLALELAASRVRVLAPKAIAAKLDSALHLLTSTAKDLPERQRTLRAALSWSHELLAEPERVLFRRLGVMNGRFGAEAAAEVAGDVDGLDPLDGLAALLDKSLLVRTEALGEPRFHMLETVREFARERCVEAGEEHASRRRHAEWAVRFAESEMPHVTTSKRVHIERFALEDAHVRVAMQWCMSPKATPSDRALGWRLYFAYACVAQMQMRVSDVLALHAAFVAGGEPEDEVVRARVVAVEAWAAGTNGDMASQDRMAGALPLLRAHGPAEVHAWASAVLGMGKGFMGDPVGSELLNEAVRTFDAVGDDFGMAFAAGNLALFDIMAGQAEPAMARLRAAVQRCERNDCDEGASISLSGLARAALMGGDIDLARKLFADAAAFARDRRTVWGRTDALTGLCSVLLHQGDKVEAEAILEETLLTLERGGTAGAAVSMLVLILGPLADLLAQRGDRARAARVFAGVPDGAEDTEDPMVGFIDQFGGMRGGIRAARAAVGAEARALRESGVTLDDALRAGIGARARE